MNKAKRILSFGLASILLLSGNISAIITHGSMKGNTLPLYDQGAAGGNTSNPAHTPTLDYKVVTIGSKTWAWIKSNGSTIDTGAEWTSQLRYWTEANAKTENNMINRNAGSNAATETWTKATASMPSPVRLSFFNVLMTGGWAETELLTYDPTAKNSLVSGDITPPIVNSCQVISYASGMVTLAFTGYEGQSGLFYYITGTGIEEVSFGNNINLTALASNTVYTVTVTPVDFSGNEGTPISTTFKTMKSAGVSNIANNLGLNYNSTVTNVSGGEYVSIIQQSGNSLTLGLTSASDVITSGAWRNRVLVNPSVRVDGVNYPLALDEAQTTGTVTFTDNVGGKAIESGANLSIRWSVYNPGEFFTGTFSYTIGGADVEGPSVPVLSLTDGVLSWSPSTDAGSGVKAYEIYEAGQPTLTRMDLNELSFSYNLINTAATVSVRAIDFIGNSSVAAAENQADHFRSKASGNWHELSSWEFSNNNADWTDAVAVPTSAATSISIRNGHLITVDAAATAGALYIQPGGMLTLPATKSLTVNTLTLQSSKLTGNGTFVQKGTLTATNVYVQQYLKGGRNWYISSPMVAATRSIITSASEVVGYNETNASWPVIQAADVLTPAKGYIAVIPTEGTITYSGSLNTGNISTDALPRHSGVSKEGFHLVGNPYPSYADFNSATRTNLQTTLWYRTKNAANNYVFDTFNASNGQGTSLNNENLIPVTGVIAPMQAFWIRVLAGGGELVFDNESRSHLDQAAVTNRLKAPSQGNNNQQIIRLQISNGLNRDETILVYNENASDDFDAYDSPKMTNATASIPEIYTIAGNEKLVINGLRGTTPEREIKLGFTTGIAGSFKLKVSEMVNFDEKTKVYLTDNQELKITELSPESSYEFSSDIITDNESRFTLQLRAPGVTTGMESPTLTGTRVFVNQDNKIEIMAPENSHYAIYNTMGQILNEGITSANHFSIDKINQTGLLIVKLSHSGKNIVSKITIK